MSITAVWREYNPSTGNLLGTVDAPSFKNVNIGEFSAVKVFDLYVPDVSYISNLQISISSSSSIVVNLSPTNIGADGTAENGNFGIELSEDFVPRNSLVRFFAGINEPVIVGTRGNNVSNFIFLNVRMIRENAGAGNYVHSVKFDYS